MKDPIKIPTSSIHPDDISLHREDLLWQKFLQQLAQAGKLKELKKFLGEIYPADIAFWLEGIDFNEGRALFELIKQKEKANVLMELHVDLCQQYLRAHTPQEIIKILEGQSSDHIAYFLEKLDDVQQRKTILEQMPVVERSKIIELLDYAEGTAGAMMNKDYISVSHNVTVQKAINALRRNKRKESIHNIFIVDDASHYIGHITLPRLVLARPQEKVKKIMERELLPIPVETDQEEVTQFFTRYDFISAPVVNSEGVLLGRITADEVLQIVQEEASEDILRMSGVISEENLNTPLLRSAATRLSWLGLNLLTALLASAVVNLFEQTIEKVLFLAALLPVVASIGSNTGCQSMALITRSITLGELSAGQNRRYILRELSIILLNGPILGLGASVIVYFITQSLFLSCLLFSTLLGNMLIASLVGTLIPQLLRRLKFDPAIGSVILVTACTDIFGFFLLLGIAFFTLQYIPIQ